MFSTTKPGSGAHPRSRGENNDMLISLHQDPGSSPLTRGKRPARQPRHPLRGLIPAHAGKTHVEQGGDIGVAAHPRSRGENYFSGHFLVVLIGSSPLTRGKQTIGCARKYRVRLIPAHAGKTFPAALRLQNLWAHPRSRGENHLRGLGDTLPSGSSPLTRGKRL